MRGFTPKMVIIASLGERPEPPKPSLSVLSEGGCAGWGEKEGGREGRKEGNGIRRWRKRRKRRRVSFVIARDNQADLIPSKVESMPARQIRLYQGKLWKPKHTG